jgi:hypothetical protein
MNFNFSVTYEEIFELERQFNFELSEECNALMQSGDAKKIEEGFQVQYGRFLVREFLNRIYRFAHNNRLQATPRVAPEADR